MADIFVSYTSKDRDWAFWISQELLNLGHTPHVHEWEIKGGGDIEAWMEERHDKADHVLCVVSEAYLKAPHSSRERRSAQWAIDRPNFALPVFVEDCKAPSLFANIKRCDLHGLSEDDSRARLGAFMKPPASPTEPVSFPGTATPATNATKVPVAFPGGPRALSNIPITVPRFFLGRDEVLAEIKTALASNQGRVAITALHGMRGVGKTTLAAAYADRHRSDYRATWWIRAATESTLRADLVGLAVRLGWVAPVEKEELAIATVMERLRDEGAGILLIFDNAIDADSVEAYFPTGGDARVLVTSNAHAWRNVATPLEIDTWPPEIGADYLISRTGRKAERQAALALSDALGGLPLAHEQAAAYCERLEVPLATYHRRYEAAPVDILDGKRDAPRAYNNRLTAARAFALAIDEAAKLHPAAEPLIVYAALLAPEPIPLFLFSEGREKFGEPVASAVADCGLDEAVAALRAFALVDREVVPDERESSTTTDCIRLHYLIRQVARARRDSHTRESMRSSLIAALAAVYPEGVLRDPKTWSRARRLDAVVLALLSAALPVGADGPGAYLMNQLALYRQGPLAAYDLARPLLERALAIGQTAFGPDHLETAGLFTNYAHLLQLQGDLAGSRVFYERSLAIVERAVGPDQREMAAALNNIGTSVYAQGDYASARLYYERALAIVELADGFDHPDTAAALNNLGDTVHAQGDYASARLYYERGLAICETALGPDHPDTASCVSNIGRLLLTEGDLVGARSYFERALATREKVLGPDHPDTTACLNVLGHLLASAGDVAGARPYYERALAVREKALGPDHPDTATCFNIVGYLLATEGNMAGARPYYERALAVREKALGPDHPDTAQSLNNFGYLLRAQGDLAGARPYYERALAVREKALGPDHPDTAMSLNNLGALLQLQGDLARARRCHERALAIREKALGRDHPDTAMSLNNLGHLLQAQGDLAGARRNYERALAIREKTPGPDHPDTATSLNNLGYLLGAQGDLTGARPYYERALAIYEKTLGPAHPSTQTVARNMVGLLEALKCSNEANALREKFGVGE